MTEQQDHISRQRVVYAMAGVDSVAVRRGEEYGAAAGGFLPIDLYYPPAVAYPDGTNRPVSCPVHEASRGSGGSDPTLELEDPAPAVVLVTGFSDAGAQRMFGCPFKDMGAYVCWAKLIAASGLVAVSYANADPARDVHTVLDHLQRHAERLRIDASRVGIWSCSGHVANALAVLMSRRHDFVKCAALLYGYTLDLGGATDVAGAARRFGFVTPAVGSTVEDLPADVPLFVVRAGRDGMPGLNAALDRFVAAALSRNLPVTVVNHHVGPHAFDLFDNSAASHDLVRQTLRFLQTHLADQRR
jgi:hypothetical protein